MFSHRGHRNGNPLLRAVNPCQDKGLGSVLVDTLDMEDSAFVIYYYIVFLNHNSNIAEKTLKVKKNIQLSFCTIPLP